MSTGMQLRNGHIVGQNILPVQGRPAFEEGVRLIFAKWTALALAVENQWGGGNSKEKAELLYQDCLDWFYKKRGETLVGKPKRRRPPFQRLGRTTGATT